MRKITITYDGADLEVTTKKLTLHETIILLEGAIANVCQEEGIPREQLLAIALQAHMEGLLWKEDD